MDETGFIIGAGRAQIILTLQPKKLFHMPLDTNRDFMTSIEAISAAGRVIPPFLIFKGKQIYARLGISIRRA